MIPRHTTLLLSLAVASCSGQLAFAQAVGRKICEINADGTGFRDLYVVPDNTSVGSPAFSPDGKTLALEEVMIGSKRGEFYGSASGFYESGPVQSAIMTVPTSVLPLNAFRDCREILDKFALHQLNTLVQ